jgi:hypothetical protein
MKRGGAGSQHLQVSDTIDRSVVWNEDVLNQEIRRPARPCRMLLSRFGRDLPSMAFEVPLPLSTSETSGRGPPAVADQALTILDSWRRGLWQNRRVIANSIHQIRRFGPADDLARAIAGSASLPAKETRPACGCVLETALRHGLPSRS